MSPTLPPTPANTGPRVPLTIDTQTGMSGYNQRPDADGIVRYSGRKFTASMQVQGTHGGPHLISGYEFTDCEFAAVTFMSSLATAPQGVTLDHCTLNDISSVLNSGYPVTLNRCCLLGVNGSPLQAWRYTPQGTPGVSLTDTPTTATECYFGSPYPAANISHFEALHIRGGKNQHFTRCTFDVGWNRNPDDQTGRTTPITSNVYIEPGYGGNDDITFDNCWHYGSGPFYGLAGTGTRVRFRDGWWAQNGPQGDYSHDGSNQPGPAINLDAGQPDWTVSGYRWLIDGTPVAPGLQVNPDGSHTTCTWH